MEIINKLEEGRGGGGRSDFSLVIFQYDKTRRIFKGDLLKFRRSKNIYIFV